MQPRSTRIARTFLSELARRSSGANVVPPRFTHASRNVLNNLRVGPRGSSLACHSPFLQDGSPCWIQNRIFDAPNKHLFLDPGGSWCHLCREPLGVSAAGHLSDREHHNHQLFLFLAAAFPRGEYGEHFRPSFSPHAVFTGAARSFPRLVQTVVGGHVHTEQDALRRASLESMLIDLSDGESRGGRPILTAFHGAVAPELAHSGERLFKGAVSRLIVEWFPALGPGAITQIAHKCWGRSNLESVFDALRMQSLVNWRCSDAAWEASPAARNIAWKSVLRRTLSTKTEKATFVRSLLWELTTRCEEAAGCDKALPYTETEKLMLELTRRQLAFEMVFLQSMKYMQHADQLLREMSFPSVDTLMSMGAA
ncbi:uncharacterized protein Tco025E_08966 [Trypanosoma conorhini]|uniref:Uncharacterized protein n=1 Tax=Trypanosoma conorhini TaxID=83891 RepID=A0A422N2E3_9TRYP|nr:uncharacterized protein Tco025E_08966 [Trypanosoma conorhini]RNE99634.1 hypothetical protein Tco025E_08966 [Trypanosoma conorhini]